MSRKLAVLYCAVSWRFPQTLRTGRLTFTSDQALLDKYGLKANDAILADPEKHMGLYEDLIKNYKAVLIAGGAAQNTARGAAVR